MKTPRNPATPAPAPMDATAAGWLIKLRHPIVIRDPLSRYVSQLLEEGFASSTADGVLIPWDRVYDLLADSAHETSLALLALPAVRAWTPQLISRGAFTDPDFAIGLSSWTVNPDSSKVLFPRRVGGCLIQGDERSLMPAGAWMLVRAVIAFSETSESVRRHEDSLAVARIRALAIGCGARLDDYLARTEIVPADRLELRLTKTETLGAPVVTVTPHLPGAPPEWIQSFDRYDRVHDRYDVSLASGGLARVIPSAGVRDALGPIKAMKGRRVASDAARTLLYNPYAVLGDGAAEVLPPDVFEQARASSGILFRRLQAVGPEGAHAFTAKLVEPSGGVPDLPIRLTADSAQDLLARAERSTRKQLPLFSWDGEEIELTADTRASLAAVKSWIGAQWVQTVGVAFADVFDLSAYSDRVVGFDGKGIAVPYVARRDDTQGWIPDNIETGIVVSSTETQGAPRRVPLDSDQLATLSAATAEAKRSGSERVTLPGTNVSVAVAEAEEWVETLAKQQTDAAQRVREPELAKDPPPPLQRPNLRILHNIESLDYGAHPAVPPASPNASVELPACLRADRALLPHQVNGLAWLQHRFGQQAIGVQGCLLADDMGLGKTLQSLCFIAWSRAQPSQPKPSLIVAPVSLLENWKREVTTFFDGTEGSLLSLYGPTLQSLRLSESAIDPQLASLGLKKFLRPDFQTGHAIVLTTYETLRDYEFSLAPVEWGVVVCDEAQKIKNPAALVTRAAKALQADFKIACTGTPVENSLADLWCLFDLFQPGLLSSLNEFTQQFRRRIETREEGHAQLTDSLRQAIDPWILRRMKTEVAQLPPKVDHHISTTGNPTLSCAGLPMSPLQKTLYGETIREFRERSESDTPGSAILGVLHRLRMICSHPAGVAYPDWEYRGLEEQIAHSPKLGWLLQRLAEIRVLGEKAIVFTEFREVQRLIQSAIGQRFDIHPDIINGDTTVDAQSSASRQRLIDRYQAVSGFNVIVLSTTAVGFGVNIQAANHVVHFTRPWNPAKEDQATDRAYRIGQTKPVYVYCPTVVAAGFETFDQRLDSLLTRKRTLSRDLLVGAQEITAQDFKGL